jgi:hypothetical protein
MSKYIDVMTAKGLMSLIANDEDLAAKVEAHIEGIMGNIAFAFDGVDYTPSTAAERVSTLYSVAKFNGKTYGKRLQPGFVQTGIDAKTGDVKQLPADVFAEFEALKAWLSGLGMDTTPNSQGLGAIAKL